MSDDQTTLTDNNKCKDSQQIIFHFILLVPTTANPTKCIVHDLFSMSTTYLFESRRKGEAGLVESQRPIQSRALRRGRASCWHADRLTNVCLTCAAPQTSCGGARVASVACSYARLAAVASLSLGLRWSSRGVTIVYRQTCITQICVFCSRASPTDKHSVCSSHFKAVPSGSNNFLTGER